MKEFTYTIKEPVGIHARPAGMLAKEAKTCQSTVTIVDKNGKSVDATRLMALMGMGIKCGDTVTVKATSRHSGGRTAVNQVELFDGQGRLLLTSSFTMYYMDGKK